MINMIVYHALAMKETRKVDHIRNHMWQVKDTTVEKHSGKEKNTERGFELWCQFGGVQ